ncbi:MAG: M81 family metallopeptidase [Clostridia bacterium]|nr:M81 family metallopeptidase [Clostridia bacterium]
MKKVIICGIHQESNAFNPVLAEDADFSLFEGNNITDDPQKAGATTEGMITCLLENGFDPVGGIVRSANSGGPLNKKVVENFIDKAVSYIKAAGDICGVLMPMHGATVSEESEDVCGDIIAKVREAVGKDVVVAASFDMHANITAKIAENADVVCGYQTYPHLDFYGVGYRAAKMLVEKLSGRDIKMVRTSVPMMAPAHGYTTTRGKLNKLIEKGHKLVEKGEILDFSIFQVQPWLDIKTIGSSIIVIAEDQAKAKQVAMEFAKEEFALREELQGEKLFGIQEVIDRALKNTDGKPVVLVNSADSVNAGANGDSAAVVEQLLSYSDRLVAATFVVDAPAVEKAFELGVGATADFVIGATIAPMLSNPVEVKNAYIKSLHDGKYYKAGPASRGTLHNIGRTAVLEVGKLRIHICEKAACNTDINCYRSFGTDPELCNLVCVKACTSFRAGYEPIASEICNTLTPGAAGPVLKELPYKKLPKPFYPFEEIDESMIGEIEVY